MLVTLDLFADDLFYFQVRLAARSGWALGGDGAARAAARAVPPAWP